MSLVNAAKYLESKGRNGDSMLVHMSPGEVKSLQGLALAHGGSLSINPDTGLVEASFLKRILPMVAGAALTGLSGGVINPATAGMLMGGFETLRTGDLSKGLMAGLGAYGGAGLGSALSTAGGEAAASALANPTVDATAAYQKAMESGATGDIAQKAFMDASNVPQNQMLAGLKQVTASPENALGFAKNNLMNIGAAAAPMVGDMLTQPTTTPGIAQEDERYKGAPYSYRLSPSFRGYVPNQPNPYYRPTGLGYAEGGGVNLDNMAPGGLAALQGMRDGYEPPQTVNGDEPQFAMGGELKLGEGIAKDTDTDTASLGAYDAAKKRLEKIGKASNVKMAQMPKTGVSKLGEIKMASGGLGGYSDGGRMLKGPGDGMSDDIPAVIGSKQPARLADGEFVVPADVVSHLGNGSTDAGARKLYKMMDKVRVARTGKKKQAPAVKTDKYLPT